MTHITLTMNIIKTSCLQSRIIDFPDNRGPDNRGNSTVHTLSGCNCHLGPSYYLFAVCEHLNPPANGKEVTYEKPDDKKILVNSLAIYKCKDGYHLVGKDRYCTKNGWNGTVPTCVGRPSRTHTHAHTHSYLSVVHVRCIHLTHSF